MNSEDSTGHEMVIEFAVRRTERPGPAAVQVFISTVAEHRSAVTRSSLPSLLKSPAARKTGSHPSSRVQYGAQLSAAESFVSMLQRMGLETDQFASATCTMRGLELVWLQRRYFWP